MRARVRKMAAPVLAALVIMGVTAACQPYVHTYIPDLGEVRDPATAPVRYVDEVFPGVTVTSNIVWGQAPNRAGVPVSLALNLYEPTGDTVSRRPALVVAHSGGFKVGTKTNAVSVDLANRFARKGYVGASISYRLSAQGCTVIDAACVESIVDATEDAQSAVRYFRANAATYGIDPDRIAIWGTSAGAITAMNVGFRAVVPGNGANPGVSSDVEAAVSFSGGRLLGSCDEGDATTLLFHGTADPLTPYQWATNTVTCAQDAGVWVHLTSWEGQGHVPYAANRSQIVQETTSFLWNALSLRLIV